MSRYIDAEALYNTVNEGTSIYGNSTLARVLIAIDNAPTADVEEVRHGEWIPPQFLGRSGFYNIKEFNCNLCDKVFWVADGHRNMNYCPNCGAKMDGERREE